MDFPENTSFMVLEWDLFSKEDNHIKKIDSTLLVI